MSESEYDGARDEPAADPAREFASHLTPRRPVSERSSHLWRATLIVSLVYLAILLAVFLTLRAHGVFA